MEGRQTQEIVFSRSRLRAALVVSTALVSAAGLAVEVLRSIFGWKGRSGVVPLLSLSYEQNVPTYHTALLLLLASAMSGLLATVARRAGAIAGRRAGAIAERGASAQAGSRAARADTFAWWGLCAGFAYIAVDEVISIHETWGAPFRLSGVLHFGWVIPAACILIVLAVLYSRFLWRLPRRPRTRLVAAGGVYVLGAVFMELPLGWWTEKEGSKNLEYALIDWTEETLEMAGIVLFVLVAFDLLASAGAVLRFGPPPAADTAARAPEPPAANTASPAPESPAADTAARAPEPPAANTASPAPEHP